MKKLSVCVITLNEERNIKRCLQSVAWADELVVVDSGSSDKTVTIARELGATVLETDWPGWAKQKNRSIDAASYDWILSLDADEWLPEGSERIVRDAMNQNHDSYTLRRKTFFLGRWIAHQGWYPDRQIRLFDRKATRFSEVPVHEKVLETPETADLDLDIMHESYVNLRQYVQKNRAYSSAQARQQRDSKWVLFKLFAKPPARFLQTYVLQKGFLDGWQGLLLATLRAWYEVSVQMKILRLRTSRR